MNMEAIMVGGARRFKARRQTGLHLGSQKMDGRETAMSLPKRDSPF
jgi:hypothetical protein